MESEENGKVLILPTPILSRLYDSAFDPDFGFSLGPTTPPTTPTK